jgi:hypothetical protein
MLSILIGHLRKTSGLSGDQVICQMHEKRLIANRRSRTKDCVPEPQRLTLPYIDAGHSFGHDVLDGP